MGCSTGQDVTSSGIATGSGAGQVTISGEAVDGYVLTGHSKSTHTFTYTKSASGGSRTCAPNDDGGCNGGSW